MVRRSPRIQRIIDWLDIYLVGLVIAPLLVAAIALILIDLFL